MFCGRDREIREIEQHAKASRHVVLSALPGMGLTALIEEALAPAWRAEGFIAVSFREWQGRGFATEFREALAEAVRQQADPGFFVQPELLVEMIERIRVRTRKPVALLLDQFEDYLRCHVGTDISDFFDAELSHAIAGRECRVVIALQEHAIEAFRRFEQYVPNLMGFHVRLGPLYPAEAKELVARAAAEHGVAFEPALVDALVGAPAAECQGGARPFFLMAGVQRLLDAAREGNKAATGALVLEAYGGADRLILESLDSKLASLTPTQAELFLRWCNLLLSDKDERRAVTTQGLSDCSGKLNRLVPTLLPVLTEAGILRTIDLPGGVRCEFARECQAPLIRDWCRRREAALIAKNQADFRVRALSLAAVVIVAALWVYLSSRR